MFFVNSLRLIKYSIQGFFRNFWLSFVCITTMVIAFILVDILGGLNIISENIIDTIKDKVDVSVYFKTDVTEDKIFAIKHEFESIAGVKEVQYISKDQALEDFKKKHMNNDVLMNSLNTLTENPIGATLIIKANSVADYPNILNYLSNFKYKDLIENTDYTDNKLIVDKLNNFNDSLTKVLLAVGVFFAFISAITVINTLRITIYSRRKEIEIMRFLGASWSFIKIPFILEGVFYLLAGWLISTIAYYVILIFLNPYINLFFNLYNQNLSKLIMHGSIQLIFIELAVGIVITVISSLLSIRKYAKV
ncbi:MAG TPA: permease-like cell division protein FtsX [bacterium]|nr:permease-like cell division protein FtsX [bacterium]